MKPIAIRSYGSLSPLGTDAKKIWNKMQARTAFFQKEEDYYAAVLTEEDNQLCENLKGQNQKYKKLDSSVIYAILASRKAMENLDWDKQRIGINLGSSRGATGLFEGYFSDYLNGKKLSPLSSPTTTLGNLASWVAQDIGIKGPVISHSMTCSSALQALINGVAWIESGRVDHFLVGGSEAPLTPFTIAQMKALKVYAQDGVCRALDFSKNRNSMILGEGACVLALEREILPQTKAVIKGIGYATESISHGASLSVDGLCFQEAMVSALDDLPLEEVDIIVMHAPGTIKGDQSEYKAIQAVFGSAIPALTGNKAIIGHTFGASGALSIEFALLMLEHQEFISSPYATLSFEPKKIQHILVNAVGFGGSAVSVLISKI